MRRLSFKQLVVLALIFIAATSLCNAQDRAPSPGRKGVFGLFTGKKAGGIKHPKSAHKVEIDSAKKKKKQDADYAKSVRESQKRSVKIQTPEVQERMKQNKKDVTAREKARMKKTAKTTRKAGRKYK